MEIYGGAPRGDGSYKPYQNARRWRALQWVPLPGRPTWKSLRLDHQPLTQLWQLGIESTFMVDPMNARLLEDICFNTASRLAVMTLHPRLHHPLRVRYLTPTTLRIAVDKMDRPVKILQHLHYLDVLERSFPATRTSRNRIIVFVEACYKHVRK